MIPVSTFNVLIAVDILFIIYAIIDHENRLYANIVVAFISAVLSAFLNVMISTEMVYDEVSGAMHFITSPSVGYFFLLISTIMFVYTIFMVYEVIDAAAEDKKATMQPQEDI